MVINYMCIYVTLHLGDTQSTDSYMEYVYCEDESPSEGMSIVEWKMEELATCKNNLF